MKRLSKPADISYNSRVQIQKGVLQVMNPMSSWPQVAEAVQAGPIGVGLTQLKIRLKVPYFRWLGVTVIGLSTLLLGILLLSNNGDWPLLTQRLFGQVQLSSGTYSAKTVAEVNRLTWQWGLDTMEALTQVETALSQLETLLASSPDDNAGIQKAKQQLTLAEQRLNTLMADKTKLQKVSKILHIKQFYAPELSDSLFQLQVRMAAIHNALSLRELAH